MCLGLPMRVIEVGPGWALCASEGETRRIDTALVGAVVPGDWLMTFLGAAREIMSEAEAGRSTRALNALAAVMRGDPVDLDAAFADLLDPERHAGAAGGEPSK